MADLGEIVTGSLGFPLVGRAANIPSVTLLGEFLESTPRAAALRHRDRGIRISGIQQESRREIEFSSPAEVRAHHWQEGCEHQDEAARQAPQNQVDHRREGERDIRSARH